MIPVAGPLAGGPFWPRPRRESDQALNTSFVISLFLHGALGLLWWQLHLQQRGTVIRLESVELMEVLKEAQVVPEPAQRAPRNVLEFLKMALPQMRKPALREVEAPEARPQPRLEQATPIDLSKRVELKTAPTLDLSRRSAPAPAAALSEVVPAASPKDRTMLPVEPSQAAIRLDEVGRRRVAAPPPPAIVLGGGRPLASSPGDFRDIRPAGPARASSPPPKEVAAPVALERPGVKLGVGKSIAPEALPLGFGRGRLEGLRAAPALADVVQAKPGMGGAMLEKSLGKAGAVEIAGPLSRRKVLKSLLPQYPEWARRKGIEADVSIRLFVAPDGAVRGKMTVERTSGHLELDRIAMEALRRWLFEPAPAGGDQWGVVTFRFRLE